MKELGVYEQLTQLAYLPIYFKLLRGAMELNVFSHLTVPVTAEHLARDLGWHEANTRMLLDALFSLGFVKKNADGYVNAPETGQYLVVSSEDYAGGFLTTYMQEGLAPLDVAKLVREGPDPAGMGQMDQQLDFTRFGDAFRAAQRGCRQQEVLRIIRSLPENERLRNVLDIGCNAGLLGLAVIADMPERKGVLFDKPPLQPVIEGSIAQMGLTDRARAQGGDFLTDDLGGGYDLILAISVMLFAKGDLPAFLKKLYDALEPGGVAVSIGEGVNPDFSGPWDMVMGYLPYWFQGMDLALRKGEIEAAAKEAGFRETETRTGLLCSGTQDIVILRK